LYGEMIRVNPQSTAGKLLPKLERFWSLSGEKLVSIQNTFDFSKGSPVFTVQGRYQPQAWTEWTLGFHYGSAILQYDATGDSDFLEMGRSGAVRDMPSRITHRGVHDHGFNIVSTYGNLLRLAEEGRLEAGSWEKDYYRLALKCSAAVQASRWTDTANGGFIYSFNGPHSLFADTIRSLRILAVGHLLGHRLMDESDREISLLERLIVHAETTARSNIYYGEERDHYDVRGRVAHESLFNTNDGTYRCPSTQQGYSPRSTWTRGLAWIILGFAEQIEFLDVLDSECFEAFGDKTSVLDRFVEAARAASDYYMESSPANGIPYWDTGAPGLRYLKDYLETPADPFNDYEPVDSSAAAIAAQGLLRLGHFLETHGTSDPGYRQAGLTVAETLFESPYLSFDSGHQGLILHSVYHRPNGWDYVPEGRRVPCGESSMWGDYHARELALYLQRIAGGGPYLTFWAKEGRS